jgi:hypothetical protein
MNKFLKYFLTISLSLVFSIIFVPQVFALDSCTEDADCTEGQYCESETFCVDKSRLGRDCMINDECFSNICSVSQQVCCDENNVCTEEIACTDDIGCPEGEFCVESICKVQVGLGRACTENSGCLSNQGVNDICCDGDQCREVSPVVDENQVACNTINSLPSNLKETACKSRSECIWSSQNSTCSVKPASTTSGGTANQAFCSGFNRNPLGVAAAERMCKATGKCNWTGGKCVLIPTAGAGTTGTTENKPAPSMVGQKILPACALDGSCRSLNDLIQVGINLGDLIFSVIGSLAFVMFVYGGFMIILSMGNAERVKKGQQILVAAVIGMAIAFGAYILVDFILDSFGVASDFRAV